LLSCLLSCGVVLMLMPRRDERVFEHDGGFRVELEGVADSAGF
jgi:hypothetical protein